MLLSVHQIFNRVAVVWSYKCREAGRNYQVGKMVGNLKAVTMLKPTLI